MTATALVAAPNTGVASLDTLAAIAVYARSVDDPEELHGLAARINAARELAKAQEDVRDIRRMLMHAEVAVLIRRHELSDPKLTTWDKVAIRAFLREGDDGTRNYVDSHFEEFGKAAQMGRALHKDQQASDALNEGTEFARSPEQIAKWRQRLAEDAPRNEWQRENYEEYQEAHREDVAATMRELVEGYTNVGEPFTVEDVTDALLDRMGGSMPCAEEGAFRDGVRRVVRESVRASGAIQFEGENLPSTIAVESPQGWVRIPIASATPAHLADTIREREEQIARDQASVRRLSRLLAAINERGCGEFEPIAGYIPA